MASSYSLTKSKYVRGLQCVKALYLDVFRPELAYYDAATLALFRAGRIFEKSFKNTFPRGVDVSSRLGHKMDQYPKFTADMLMRQGEVELFEAGFLYNGVLVLADVVHKSEDGNVDIYEVKNGTQPKEVFRRDVAIQCYVISHALVQFSTPTLFEDGLRISHFYLLYNDGNDGFVKLDLLDECRSQFAEIESNVVRFKAVLAQSEPEVVPSDSCGIPYECPYKAYCGVRRNAEKSED